MATSAAGQEEQTGPSALERYLEYRGVWEDTTGAYKPYVAVFPFEDDSGFPDDIWDLENDMARLLSAEMASQRLWHIVPYDAVVDAVQKPEGGEGEAVYESARLLRADVVLLGTLLDLNMERLSVGDPLLGGYKSYKGLAEIELKVVRVEERSTIANVYSKRDRTDRGLGLDLLGKPRAQDRQFVDLGEMAFGSVEFRATGIGLAVMAVMGELVEKLGGTLRPRGLLLADGQAEVLSAHGGEIFINIGSENGVYKGQRFEILPAPDRVRSDNLEGGTRLSVVQVQDIIGARVSRVRALYGAERIAPGDHLRVIEADE